MAQNNESELDEKSITTISLNKPYRDILVAHSQKTGIMSFANITKNFIRVASEIYDTDPLAYAELLANNKIVEINS